MTCALWLPNAFGLALSKWLAECPLFATRQSRRHTHAIYRISSSSIGCYPMDRTHDDAHPDDEIPRGDVSLGLSNSRARGDRSDKIHH